MEKKCSSGMLGKKSPTILDGKYELGRLLGHGTFAKVYHARNLVSGMSVAIKAVRKEKILKVGMMEQIKREIALMKMVKHHNIVDLHEVMATKTKIYFAMEYVKGGELFAEVARGRLREDVARAYFRQLISAVDFCHSRGVYHRDLKPENLLLDEDGNLKVTDFGLSALSDHIQPDGLLHTTCGTPAYVAPEVLAKRGYDGAMADLWSCGVILYVLLAGFLPFQDENLVAMYRKIYRGDFKCPPWFSSDARRLILKLLDPNPNTRITMANLIETPWFKKQSSVPPPPPLSKMAAFEAEDDLGGSGESMNAFHIISLSQGFDLSPLFEGKKKAREELRFTAKESASNVLSKLEEVAKEVKFSVKRGETRVKMQGPDNSRKGHLGISLEVFAVTPAFSVVEMKKSGGDTLEYNRFCSHDLRSALKDIVWAWQGETPTAAATTTSV